MQAETTCTILVYLVWGLLAIFTSLELYFNLITELSSMLPVAFSPPTHWTRELYLKICLFYSGLTTDYISMSVVLCYQINYMRPTKNCSNKYTTHGIVIGELYIFFGAADWLNHIITTVYYDLFYRKYRKLSILKWCRTLSNYKFDIFLHTKMMSSPYLLEYREFWRYK